jgi:hypothetical protein
MSTTDIKDFFLSKGFYCLLFRHRIVTSRAITNHFKEYKCTSCGLELTNDEKGNKTLLTPELKDINDTLHRFCIKKNLNMSSLPLTFIS